MYLRIHFPFVSQFTDYGNMTHIYCIVAFIRWGFNLATLAVGIISAIIKYQVKFYNLQYI